MRLGAYSKIGSPRSRGGENGRAARRAEGDRGLVTLHIND